jgi:hypothetical protein
MKYQLEPKERVDILTKRLANLEAAYASDGSGHTWRAVCECEDALKHAQEDLRAERRQ